jgi:hypothetical protein
MQASHTVAAATDLSTHCLHLLTPQVVHQDTISWPSEKVHKFDFRLAGKLTVVEEDHPDALASGTHNLQKASSGRDPERQLWPFVSLKRSRSA